MVADQKDVEAIRGALNMQTVPQCYSEPLAAVLLLSRARQRIAHVHASISMSGLSVLQSCPDVL